MHTPIETASEMQGSIIHLKQSNSIEHNLFVFIIQNTARYISLIRKASRNPIIPVRGIKIIIINILSICEVTSRKRVVFVCPMPLSILERVVLIYRNGHIQANAVTYLPTLISLNRSIPASLPHIINAPRQNMPIIMLYSKAVCTVLLTESVLSEDALETAGSSICENELTRVEGSIISGNAIPERIPYVLRLSDTLRPN